MDKLIDWIKGLPVWGKVILGIVVVGVLAGGILYSLFPPKPPVEEKRAAVMQEVPDAEVNKEHANRLKSYMNDIVKSASADDYWESLGDSKEGIGDGGLIVSDRPSKEEETYDGEYLDPNVYSELEIYYIKNNLKPKSEIDAEHAKKKAEEELKKTYNTSRSMPEITAAQRDSMMFARMEKAYEMASKYSSGNQTAKAEETGKESQPGPEPELEPKRIDLDDEKSNIEASYIDMDAFSDDGIITSLDEPSSSGVIHYSNSKIKTSPVKCTFLTTEKIVSGQRVIMRLMQDLMLSDGTLIPANTHITGTCETGNRLKITVTAIHYGGKMFQTNIIAFDNDGTEGIYCPVIETKKSKTAAKRVAGATASSAGSAVLGALTGNPYLARTASSVTNEMTRAIEDNGTTSVNVVSGYVFYLMENID